MQCIWTIIWMYNICTILLTFWSNWKIRLYYALNSTHESMSQCQNHRHHTMMRYCQCLHYHMTYPKRMIFSHLGLECSVPNESDTPNFCNVSNCSGWAFCCHHHGGYNSRAQGPEGGGITMAHSLQPQHLTCRSSPGELRMSAVQRHHPNSWCSDAGSVLRHCIHPTLCGGRYQMQNWRIHLYPIKFQPMAPPMGSFHATAPWGCLHQFLEHSIKCYMQAQAHLCISGRLR